MPWEATPEGLRTWIFAEGSTRGVHLLRTMSLTQGATVHVRLGAMASRADWIVAYGLLRGLLKGRGGRVVGPKERVLRGENLTEGEAVSEALSHLYDDATEVASELRGGKGYAVFLNPEFDLLVTPAMLPASSDPGRLSGQFEELLRLMAARYQRAEIVAPAALPNGQTISIWSMNDACLYWAKHMGIRLAPDAEDGVVLSAAQAMALLGSRLEVISEEIDRFFLPALDPSDTRDRALREKLMGAGKPISEFLSGMQGQQPQMRLGLGAI